IDGDGRRDHADKGREDDQRHDARLQEGKEIARGRFRHAKARFLHQSIVGKGHAYLKSINSVGQDRRAHRRPRMRGDAAYLIFGNCSHWWNGGGEGSCHSSVVAPSPHGLAPATRFFWKASKTP